MICSLVKLPPVDKQEDLHENIKRLPGYLSGCVTIPSKKMIENHDQLSHGPSATFTRLAKCQVSPSVFRSFCRAHLGPKKNIQHHTTTTITTKPRS